MSSADLDWSEILKTIQDFAISGTARHSLANLKSYRTPEEAQTEVQNIFDATEVLSFGARPFMESLDLFEPWFGRLKRKAVLRTIEIRDVRTFCQEALALFEILGKAQNPWCRKLRAQILKAEEPLSAIDHVLTPSGEIRSDASESLYRLFREKENLTKQIQQNLDRLVNDHQMQTYLQDRYVTTREGRWVLPVRSGSQHSVHGVIHGSSQTKQTVFIEPEVVLPMNNRLRQVEVEIEDEIERILEQLSGYLSNLSSDFELTREILLQADQVFAKAQWSILVDAQTFDFTEDEIFLADARHPILVALKKNPVANSIRLDQKKGILLLSGPNAGGKTVLLKTLGLAAQMARHGLPICAGRGSRLPFLKDIKICVGDAQNVEQELSTFAAHLKGLDEATRLKGTSALVLVDEICGSTDPEEGSALARAFIDRFSENGIFGVVTSHLGPLKSGWPESSRVLNGSMEYDAKTGRPSYQFLPGIPGDSMALQTARRVGVDAGIIERAIESMSPASRERMAALNQIDQMKSDLHLLQDSLKKEQNKARFEKERFEKLSEQLEKEKSKTLEKARSEAEKKIEELISQATVAETFKRHRDLQDIKMKLPEIVKSRPASGVAQLQITSSDEFITAYPPGTKVYVPHLKQDGIIQSKPNGKGEIMVVSQSIRLLINWRDLKPPEKSSNPTASVLRQAGMGGLALDASDRSLDIRGKTVEEALILLERELDQAVALQEPRLKIIHGFGTETLKKAVRSFLSRNQLVKKWKTGASEQGGDGVTWAEIGNDN